jgi:hypothetical protein
VAALVAAAGGGLAVQAGERTLADVGVEGVELVGNLAPDGFGGAEQLDVSAVRRAPAAMRGR